MKTKEQVRADIALLNIVKTMFIKQIGFELTYTETIEIMCHQTLGRQVDVTRKGKKIIIKCEY